MPGSTPPNPENSERTALNAISSARERVESSVSQSIRSGRNQSGDRTRKAAKATGAGATASASTTGAAVKTTELGLAGLGKLQVEENRQHLAICLELAWKR